MPPKFSVTEDPQPDGTVIVRVRGELDLATVDPLRECLEGLAAAGKPTVLDLSRLAFLDSTGLKVILSANRASEASGWSFAVSTEVSPPVARLFGLVDAASVLRFDERVV